MNVSDWANAFFGELSKLRGFAISYAPDGAGNFDSTNPKLRVVGSDDTFMSVWTNYGIAWDGPATRKGAVDAALELQHIIRSRDDA
jgi:hypothetical protein